MLEKCSTANKKSVSFYSLSIPSLSQDAESKNELSWEIGGDPEFGKRCIGPLAKAPYQV